MLQPSENVLIRDGHVESASAFENILDLEEFNASNRADNLRLRKKYGYKGLLIADGPLIPDQYVYALQCGFDAVKVDNDTFVRQAESDWFSAMDAFSLT